VRAPALPVNAVRAFLERAREGGVGEGRAPAQLAFNRVQIPAGEKEQSSGHAQPAMRPAALNELSVNPGRQCENDEKEAKPQCAFAVKEWREAEQPYCRS